ncbi:hypothetical protein E2C01_036628 [Portunus trituberculatus]|uniref:Uncharacterized protein n=1 Tax=Portunus trituberculatus TaxID=210409 RepID=A0A5B7FCZ9_PORTR|nr:hypothetical protein [Portunus trituberculatus]
MDQFNATSEVDDKSAVAAEGTAEGAEATEGGEEPAPAADGQPTEGSAVEDGVEDPAVVAAVADSGEALIEEAVEEDVPAKSPEQQQQEEEQQQEQQEEEQQQQEQQEEEQQQQQQEEQQQQQEEEQLLQQEQQQQQQEEEEEEEEEKDKEPLLKTEVEEDDVEVMQGDMGVEGSGVTGNEVVKDEVMMDSSPATLEGRQVVLEGGEVVTEQGEVVMEGHQVFMEGPVVMGEAPVEGVLVQGSGLTFDTSMLEGAKAEECASPASSLVMVKQEDLQDNRYGHNQQILGLVTSGVEEEEEVVVGGETQGKILLENLVSEALQSPQRPHDNIIVTTSTITPGPAPGQAPAPTPTLVRGSPPQATPTRIVVQTNQNTAQKANQGHFLIQVGGTPVPVAPAVVTPSPAASKNHIVIRAGHNQTPSAAAAAARDDPASPAQQGSIFKVIIPEGTTKVNKAPPAPPTTALDQQEPVRKHIQINLSDSTAKRPVRYLAQNASHPATPTHSKADATAGDPKKLYECPTCNSKFMRPLYLR